MVLGGHFPGDPRVTKEARSLLAAGHNITLLCKGKEGQKDIETIMGISVIRIFPSKSSIKRMVKTILSSVFFDDFEWRRMLEEIVQERGIDLIHCHDLPTVNLGKKVARRFSIPVIADLHENYPEGIQAWRKKEISTRQWLYNRLVLPLPIWMFKMLETNALQKVDWVITVIDEAKDHYVNDCKIPANRVTVVMNTEDLDEFDKLNIQEGIEFEYKDCFVISFIGLFGPHRGIDTAIRSIPHIINIAPEVRLVLVGTGPEGYVRFIQGMVEELGVGNEVIFTGWIEFDMIPPIIANSHICLVPHKANGHTNTTIPHKLFQYMAMRKPVIVSDCVPLKRIVEECECGLIFASENSKELAEAIISLYHDKNMRRRMGENGRMSVEEKYNWEIEGKKLCNVYEDFSVK
jgi:glycosyltransferase involved in cell wall biosynthesis